MTQDRDVDGAGASAGAIRHEVSPPGREIMGDGGSALGTVRSRARRARPLIIGALVLALILLINLLPGSDGDDGALSPGNPAPAGARALAEVLAEEGVEVFRARSFDAARDALEDGPATLLLNDAQQYLNADQVAELAGLADRAVLAAPGDRQLSQLDDDFALVGTTPFSFGGDPAVLGAECSDRDAQAAGNLSGAGNLYAGGVECFSRSTDGGTVSTLDDAGIAGTQDDGSGEDGAPEGAGAGGLYVTNADGSVALLGAPGILSNSAITDEGNAALALRALGSSPTLVWYEPSGGDVVSTGEGIDPLTLLPPWVDPLLVWLLVCAVLAMLWKGRRLGPLATEPLPVVVRAAETAEGRARLYQDSRSVGHAATNLRAAALARMARRLRVDRSASPLEVVDAAARHSGRPRAELEERLLHSTPTTPRDLVLWAQEILDLEKEITSP
ncbi:DUF4350 domain-containing protein [Arthrobacter agilis]|uniref:DUF4350 domain-containing protein n=1 Tax=Arthrobacter agilis TaxID=37921 RepID=UPI0023663826|nr:DUF4350 domain-containing protein [Arthrobacter agilis]WDF32429.1 DUF4350 domain-containing protein [Arthrobacter agilis]